MNGTEELDPDTRPVTSRKSSDKNSISINLQVSADPTVDEYCKLFSNERNSWTLFSLEAELNGFIIFFKFQSSANKIMM